MLMDIKDNPKMKLKYNLNFYPDFLKARSLSFSNLMII